MNDSSPWLRRLGCMGGAVLWLAILSLPLFVFILAIKGEMTWKRSEFVEDRIWLIRETENRGVAYSAARVVSNREAAGGPICVRTRVKFFMWQGAAQDAEFCECYSAPGTPLGECA
ncbi:MAG: hypothetical protein HY260_11255 [Chloroflexi bacterium]|nr:hypothetical protein [Chloroflexota bacterium]